MDDILKSSAKKVDVKKPITHYRGKQSVAAPYSSGEMHKAMCVTQAGFKGGMKYNDKPNYDNSGKLLSVKHGHHDVKGGKI